MKYLILIFLLAGCAHKAEEPTYPTNEGYWECCGDGEDWVGTDDGCLECDECYRWKAYE